MDPKFNILVVDDDLNNIQVGINFLKQKENYHLFFATSGEQAFQRIKENNFDLILLDILMPTMDGYEVCRRLKANERTKHIPVIFLTAKHGEDSLMKGFEIGGADYITKPFNAPELRARVKTHLELHYHYQQEISKLEQILIYSQKAETIKFIAGSIAHDCRNFMGAIPGHIFLLEQMLEKDGLISERYKEMFQSTGKAVDMVTDLLKQFANFSCEDQTTCEIVDMNEVVDDLKKVFKDYMRHRILLDIKMLNQPALILADKMHVEQVLLNILINAQHAILERPDDERQDGKISLTIYKTMGTVHKDLTDSTAYICTTIEDNGIGMCAETVQKIFDPYFTTRKDKGGSGLGLAVSFNIVKSHNGTIEVTSEPYKKTQFNIYFPCNDSSQ